MRLLFLLLLIPSLAFSQIEIKEKAEPNVIGTINIGGVSFVMELQYLEDLGSYLWLYRNGRYTSITDIQGFSFKEEDFETLYNAINEGLTNRDKKELEVELDNGDKLTLIFKGRTVSFQVWNGTSISTCTPFNQKQLNKLFGKAN